MRVMVVDDQELFISGLLVILKTLGKDDITVVGTAKDGNEALEKAGKLHLDVILMDVRMPVMDGVEATRLIHQAYPLVKILVLTTFDDDQYVVDALKNGAVGYILKSVQPEELMASIRAVHTGNISLSPTIGRKLVQSASEEAMRRVEKQYLGDINYMLSCFDQLTRREAEILSLLMQDLDNRRIAETLFIAEQTVRNHISAIYAKLGAEDRNHARQIVKGVAKKAGSL